MRLGRHGGQLAVRVSGSPQRPLRPSPLSQGALSWGATLLPQELGGWAPPPVMSTTHGFCVPSICGTRAPLNGLEDVDRRPAPSERPFSPLGQVARSFPPAVSDLYRGGRLRMQIVSLQAGSVVVSLRLTVWDPEFPLGVATLAPMLPPLWASTVFQVDQQGTLVQGGSSSHTRHHTLQSPGCGVSGQHPLYSKRWIKFVNLESLSCVPRERGSRSRHPQTARTHIWFPMGEATPRAWGHLFPGKVPLGCLGPRAHPGWAQAGGSMRGKGKGAHCVRAPPGGV